MSFRQSKIDNIIIIPFFIIYIPQYLNVHRLLTITCFLFGPLTGNITFIIHVAIEMTSGKIFLTHRADTVSYSATREFLSYFTNERTTKSLNGKRPTWSLIEKPCRRFCGLEAILQRTIKNRWVYMWVLLILLKADKTSNIRLTNNHFNFNVYYSVLLNFVSEMQKWIDMSVEN